MNKIPGTDGCFVCGSPEGKNRRALGIEFFWDETHNQIFTSIEPDETWCGYEEVVHGGIIAAILDDAMEHAIQQSTGKAAYTATLSMKYRKNTMMGNAYIIHAFTTEIRGKRVKAKATLADGDGTIYSEAEALFILFS